jgi:hypothetical protein
LKELIMPVNRTVVLSETAYRRLEAYARIFDGSIECAASDAIAEWMNSTGNLVIETGPVSPLSRFVKVQVRGQTGITVTSEANG